ncbi:MAG: hypothetical protein OEY49_01965, partial [Candidatus Heimdallarchaeota archaeon]|nr:hypothetical protein [Candidatus Heimdallarchaeota archaeon]
IEFEGNTEIHSKDDNIEIDEIEDISTEKHIPIVLSSKAYLKIVFHSKKYANKNIPQGKWVEVIGLLTGYIKNENTPIEQIIVEDAWPIGHGDAVSVSILETGSVAKVVENTPKGNFIIGWYHSHPSYGNFLSTDDFNTQARYQAFWDKSIALVIDPTTISKHDYGFGVFRNTTNTRDKMRYTELSSEIEGMNTQASFQIIDMMQEGMGFLDYK